MLGLTGAHRVGKSTLARAFAKEQEIPFVETTATEVFRSMGLDPKVNYPIDVRLQVQEQILMTFEKQYATARDSCALYIADRTPIDLASYLLADIDRGVLSGSPQHAEAVNGYVERCLVSAAKFFSVIVLVQPGIKTVEAEGKAPACPAYMEHLNAIQSGLLCDDRNLVRRFLIPRRFTDLNDRLASLRNAVSVAAQHQREISEQLLVH